MPLSIFVLESDVHSVLHRVWKCVLVTYQWGFVILSIIFKSTIIETVISSAKRWCKWIGEFDGQLETRRIFKRFCNVEGSSKGSVSSWKWDKSIVGLCRSYVLYLSSSSSCQSCVISVSGVGRISGFRTHITENGGAGNKRDWLPSFSGWGGLWIPPPIIHTHTETERDRVNSVDRSNCSLGHSMVNLARIISGNSCKNVGNICRVLIVLSPRELTIISDSVRCILKNMHWSFIDLFRMIVKIHWLNHKFLGYHHRAQDASNSNRNWMFLTIRHFIIIFLNFCWVFSAHWKKIIQ